MHVNKPGVKAISLRCVEKFSIASQEWIEVSPMNTARAFFGAVTIMDQFIYTFGGFDGFKMLKSFEKYDDIVNSWTSIMLELPSPLAKMGVMALAEAGNYDKTDVLILGGIGEDFVR